MTCIIHHGIVQQNQVLIRPSSPYIQTTVALSGIGYAREKLKCFQGIQLTKNNRHRAHPVHAEVNLPHLCTGHIGILLSCRDDDFLGQA